MIVVDASTIVDALTLPLGSDAVRERIDDESLHAPDLLDYEVVSGLRGLVLGGDLSSPRALDALADFDDLDIERCPPPGRCAGEPSTCVTACRGTTRAYVALAEALECPVITRDGPLSRSSGHTATIELW